MLGTVPKIAKERTQENQRRIEAAALELFTTQGFHGTNNREIAAKAGVSTGTIYTYFPSKEAIFVRLAKNYRAHMEERIQEAVGSLKEPLSRQGLKKLAAAIRSTMYKEHHYFLLLLCDVIEFRSQHFQEVFRDVPQRFRGLIGPALKRAKKQPGWRGEDPAFVLASAYLYFFTYFLVERHMRGGRHLGLSWEQATERFIDLLFHGLWRSPPGSSNRRSSGRVNSHRGGPLSHAEHDRIAYLRFLSGRLWSLPPDVPLSQSQNGAGERLAERTILFLPEIPRDRIDPSQLRIEAAALELFTKHGFHGTNIRDIAENAGVSQGAIYTFYPSKEAIFHGLVRSYRYSMGKFLERIFKAMDDPFSSNGLRLFAAAMRSMVYDDAQYWLLMYIDVIEFKNQHFLKIFRDIPEQFRRLLGPGVTQVRGRSDWCGMDAALVMAMIFFYFHTYFVIEKLMHHGHKHLGVSDEEVVDRFIDVLSHGLWHSPPSPHHRGSNKVQLVPNRN